ncbi:MAG: 2-oxo acid dehydrogenase subunit E2 [Deltaproteobacteria bacterium]|nr:2-oxo acid dehydrogenase subunit E2 [Deltaproteobacteria bacterium]
MPNVPVVPKKDITPFRKIAIGTWQDAYDPSVYGTVKIRMEKALEYIEAFRAKTGRKLTVTHLITKAVAQALHDTPDANAMLRFNRIWLRQRVDIGLQVVMTDEATGKVDLSAAKIQDADKKSLVEIIDELEAKAKLIRDRKDPALEKTRQSMGMIPFMFMNAFVKLLSFLLYELNLDLRWAGLPADPFGSAFVTSIGSLGLHVAYVPLVPYAHVPILVAPGAVEDEPVVQDGRVIPGKTMSVSATFDHRFIDGFHAARLAKTMKEMLTDPFNRFDKLTDTPAAEKPAATA